MNREMRLLAGLFCNHYGTADRIQNDQLTAMAIEGGGFFHIYSVEVRQAHQGLDLGLRMVDEALRMLGTRWTLAVLKTEPLGRQGHWEENFRYEGFADTEDKQKLVEEGTDKVKRYWSRMGFVQSGQTASLHDSYFLCRDTYFQGGTSNEPLLWKSKEEAAQVTILAPVRRPQLTGSDLELKQVLEGSTGTPQQEETRVSQILNLVRQGASIVNTNALHIAAANGETELLRALLELLPEDEDAVNAKDGRGNTALHVAAALSNVDAVDLLLEFGAISTVTNEEGDTPLQAVEKDEQSRSDFAHTFGVPAGLSSPAMQKRAAGQEMIKSLLAVSAMKIAATSADLRGKDPN